LNNASPIHAAVFDLGGVVIEVAVERTFRAWAEATGLAPEEIRRRLADLSEYLRFERGEFEPEEYRRRVVARLGRPLPDDEFDRGWHALLGAPLPGIEAVLAQLAAKRLRLVILTNTNALHAAEWRRLSAPVLPHFERVFESYTMRCRKPEPAAFQNVLDYLGLPPARVAFFDDSLENVEAAAQLGMAARLTKGPAGVRQALEELGLPMTA
jgi:putative hydrolase of the HAD superfamily